MAGELREDERIYVETILSVSRGEIRSNRKTMGRHPCAYGGEDGRI